MHSTQIGVLILKFVIHYLLLKFFDYNVNSVSRTMIKKSKKIVIGRSDKANFPEIGLDEINVKIDSGAYTSAIHCCKISLAKKGCLEVIFLDEKDPKYTGEIYKFKEFAKKVVRSSNGITEERYIIKTKIGLNKKIYDINLSLTFRGDMRFPVLLGRKFLNENNFIINPKLKDTLYKKSLKKSKKKK